MHAVLVTVVPAEVVVAWVRAAANLAASDRPHSRPAASRWAPSGQVASAEWVTFSNAGSLIARPLWRIHPSRPG